MDLTKLLPGKFKGDFKENAERWWKNFEHFTSLCGWNDLQVCNAFPLCVENNPNIWFSNLPEEISTNKEQLKSEFLNKYSFSYGENFQKFCQFEELKQNDSETAAEYINRLHEVCENQNISEERKMAKLQIKCKPELVVNLCNKDPETTTEAERQLRSVEANTEYVKKQDEQDGSNRSINQQMIKAIRDELEELKTQNLINLSAIQQVSAMNSPLVTEQRIPVPAGSEQNQRKRRYRRRRMPCYRCGECDHVPSQCRSLRVKCNKCKAIGHLAKMCRSKLKHISAQPSKLISASVGQNSEMQNLIKIRVANSSAMAMVDSGAHISAISAEFYFKYLSKVPLEKAFLIVNGISGTMLKVKGKINISVEIGRLRLQQSFYVIENFKHNIILGLDFLTNQKASLNFDTRTLVLQSGMTEVPLLGSKNNDSSICFISTVHDESIPPRSEVLIPVKTIGKSINSKIGIIEANPALVSKQNIIGANCLVHIRNNESVLQILNPTNAKIRLSKNTKIGKFCDIHTITQEIDDNILNIDNLNVNTDTSNDDLKYIKIAKNLNFDLEQSDLTEKQKLSLLSLLGKNRDVFATSLSELGCTELYPHRIDTGDAAPVQQRPYRASPEAKGIISEKVQEMLEHNIIEPSQSEWHSPVVLVQKKNKEYRFAVDFRRVNSLVQKKIYPLPKMEDIFDTLGEAKAKYYSVVDMFNGYWQQKLHPDTKHKTAFTCHEGVFEFNKLPFGLSNSPHSFQLALSEVLRGLNWKIALVYMDDILIFSRSFEEHLQHLAALFDKLKEANLKLKPTKCRFAAKEVKFLGHVLSKDGIAVDTSKTDAVSTFPKPQNTTDVRSFLGLANYYRRFVKGFSRIATPLNRLLIKGAKFVWTEECDTAFQELKNLLTTPPILAFPNFSKDFILYTDASQVAIGYVLGQKDTKGREQVISYGGRSLRGCEKNYCIRDLEFLALIEGVKQYHVYLTGRKFKIYTDHEALQHIQKIPEAERTGRIARWLMFLQSYDCEIIYKKGSKHGNADALSRRPYDTINAVLQPSSHSISTQTEEKYIDFNPCATICEITTTSKQQLVREQRNDDD